MAAACARTPPAARAAALARTAALLGGWLWLGWQGMQLGWALAGGLGVVALWWALRLLCRHALPAPAHAAARWLLGAATGTGVLLVERAELGSHGLPVLLATALAWALWCHTLSSRPGSRRRAKSVTPPKTTDGALTTRAAHALPATAMGLMMGSLWLSSQWCASAGWPPLALVSAHVSLMLLLPLLLSRQRQALAAHAHGRDGVPLALLALGGLCLAAGSTPGALLGMALQALAWALAPGAQARSTAGALALALAGPLLLWCAGQLSTTAGPAALQGAQALPGVLALAALVPLLWRRSRGARPLQLHPSTSPDAP